MARVEVVVSCSERDYMEQYYIFIQYAGVGT